MTLNKGDVVCWTKPCLMNANVKQQKKCKINLIQKKKFIRQSTRMKRHRMGPHLSDFFWEISWTYICTWVLSWQWIYFAVKLSSVCLVIETLISFNLSASIMAKKTNEPSFCCLPAPVAEFHIVMVVRSFFACVWTKESP